MRPVKIEVFSSPGCSKCNHAKNTLRKLINEYEPDQLDWREVNIMDELDYAVSMGIVSTPAIAINGHIGVAGLPTPKQLREMIDNEMQAL